MPSSKKRSLPQAQLDGRSPKTPRRTTRSTRASTAAQSPTPSPNEPDPALFPDFRRSRGTARTTELQVFASDCATSNATQSLTPPTSLSNRTNSSEATSSSPPIPLSKFDWAPRSSVKIKRTGFNTSTGAQSGLSKGGKWAGVLGQVSNLYHYARIPDNQVRLLLIKPGAFEDQINASLLVVDDDQLGSDDFPYAALSYNWGNSENLNTIIIQDDPRSRPIKSITKVVDAVRAFHEKMLKVKPNLYEALRHLRKEDKMVAMWVDALCINQFDKNEKEEQVSKMAVIYRKAYNVNIWLGSDNPDNPVSDRAMSFIPKVINLDIQLQETLLTGERHIEDWASLYELLKWSWFSRRWVIQELALAQEASVHCGKRVIRWEDFQTAISIFDRKFKTLKPRLMAHYESAKFRRSHLANDSALEIEQLGAKQLVDMTSRLFRRRYDGSYESTQGLESLVCSLSGFDTSDPRDTINAFRSISKEAHRPTQGSQPPPPMPNYGIDLFEIYRDFVKWVIHTKASVDILCRHWALKERTELGPTTPRLVQLPSWILFVEDSAWGKGEDLFRGRKAGDSFVGLPGSNIYNASGTGKQYKQAQVFFPPSPVGPLSPRMPGRTATASASSTQVTHDMSLKVTGVMIGTVSFRTDPFPDGVITRNCLEGLGWSFNKDATEIKDVPNQLWQTLVADRDEEGNRPCTWYKTACQACLAYETTNGHINIGNILRQNTVIDGEEPAVHQYLRRVRAVTWNRSFMKAEPFRNAASQDGYADHGQLVGFGPPKTEKGDILVIFYGCSVPVVLRPLVSESGELDGYHFVGEAYIYGKMDGEAFEDDYNEEIFRLL
ncbi:hypothetical protein BDW02DRAFT_582932 [Decorospora gaudefroyi]|uniref:Heterokaryon incompatibility domain-containing protein n=1 Tax=Decorospora gaudefroyi TaxID=184978 RepID=A0A6A5K6H5_9PLEO|nr:hypothetical protein BDW02DRAFT_582932 [Decorospora gaudefroyi]